MSFVKFSSFFLFNEFEISQQMSISKFNEIIFPYLFFYFFIKLNVLYIILFFVVVAIRLLKIINNKQEKKL